MLALEELAAPGVAGLALRVEDDSLRRTLIDIAHVDARHAAVLRLALNREPLPKATPKLLSPREVRDRMAGFTLPESDEN